MLYVYSTDEHELAFHTAVPLTTITFMAERQPSFLPGFDISQPQVTVVDECDEVRVTGTDLGVHANP